jgi:cytochrome P450
VTTVEFNPFDSALLSDPYPVYAGLREAGSVTRVSLMGGAACAVSRHAEVTACLRRHGDFSSDVMSFGGVGDRSLIGSDPPDHTVLRRMVTRPFHPAAIAALEPRIVAIAEDLVASMLDTPDGGEADLVKQLAEPLPVIVIAELLGIPPERREDFKRWSDAFVGVGTGMTAGADGGSALAEMAAYFDEVIRDRRRNPGDDLISVLATGTERLSDRELLGFCILLLVAGNETTTNLLGNAMSALLAHPDQLQKLRTEPDLIPAAIEEVLRYDPPVQFLFRRARATVELGEQLIREKRTRPHPVRQRQPRRTQVPECRLLRHREGYPRPPRLRRRDPPLPRCPSRSARGARRARHPAGANH